MKRSTDQPPPQPQCALNPPQQNATGSSSSNNSHQYQLPRDDRNSTQNRAPGRNSIQQYPVQPKRENQRMSQSWPANNYNNTNNNPWEGEWADNPSAKNDPWSGNPSAKNESWAGSPPAKSDPWLGNPSVKNETWSGNSPAKNEAWSVNPPAKNEPWSGNAPVKNEPWAGSPPVKNEHWTGNPPVKSEPEQNDYYKQPPHPSRVHPPPSYPSSGGEWPPGPSTSSGTSGSGYGMMPHGSSNSAASSSYSENNGYSNYNSSYNNYEQVPYTQTNNYNPQSSYHQSTRIHDSYQQQPKQQYQHPHHHNQQHHQPTLYHHQQPKQHYPQSQYHPHHQSQYPHPRSQPHQPQSSNNISRMPSVCPPGDKQEADRSGQVPDYQHMQKQYGMGMVPRTEIKQEPPDDYQTAENENFSSIFSHSLSSLYNDLENGDDPDIMVLDSQPRLEHSTAPVLPPQEMNPPPAENHITYQRLHSSGGHFVCNPSIDLRDAPSTSYGNYGNGVVADSQGNVMQEIGAPGASNSFRYDRPSFDDMHLYGPSTSADTRTPAKKRKANGPPAPTESSSERSKKCPRMMHLNSESQWTPNSFGFDANGVKQEPIDDYGSMEVETLGGPPHDTSSPGSSGTGSNSRPSDQPHDSKQPQKKRSPTTCFERFEKKSVDAKKKVSPISIYGKVVDNVVIAVKCRRYKKRTKPAKAEECVSPCRMEVETYRQYSLTPEQAALAIMRDIIGRVTLMQERFELGSTDLSEMDPYKIQQLFLQFCHRYNLDFRDFENTELILIPRIIADTVAKNSERASAIRRRINSPSTVEPQPSTSGIQQQREVKTKRRRTRTEEPENSNNEPVEPRVLRQLPWRQARNNVSGYSPFAFSSRNAGGENVDIIDLSSEEEQEQAARGAEVRKKSQPSKGKRPSRKTQVRGDRILKESKSKEFPVGKEFPVDMSRSNAKGKQSAKKKSLVEICLDDSEEPPAARSRSRDKSKRPARENSLDKFSNGGLAGIQTKQEPMDDYPSTELEASTSGFESLQSRIDNCKPTELKKDLESQKQCEIKLNAREQSLEVLAAGSVENDISCNVRLTTIQIKQEPFDDYPSIESSHQEILSVNSGIESSQPMEPQEKQESSKNAKEQSLEETRNRDLEDSEAPVARSRSRSKGKQSVRKNQLLSKKSLDKHICNGGLEKICIKQEPIDNYKSTELGVTTVSLNQKGCLESSGIGNSKLPEQLKKAKQQKRNKENVRDQSLEQITDSNLEEVSKEPGARSRSKNKVGRGVGKKQLARKKSLDKLNFGGLEGLKIKQELIDDYENIQNQVPSQDVNIFSGNHGTRSRSSEQPKNEPKKPQKKRGRSIASTREQNLEIVGFYEGLRRSTRSSARKAEVPQVDYKPLTRKRLRSMYSSDSTQTQEIVDITRSCSPPLLVAVNIECSPSKTSAQTKSKVPPKKGKNTARGRKTKNRNVAENETPSVLKMQAKVKTEGTSEDEPPVLHKVSRKRTVNSRYIDDDIYVVPSGPRSRSRSNSCRTEPPTLPVIEAKIKIKQEPVSPPKKCQNNKLEHLNGASAKKAHDHDSSLSDSLKELKNKGPETPKSTIVKSGSSKRKQGDPTKFQKDKFKNIGFPQFLQPSSIPMTVASCIESTNIKKNSNPNSILHFTSPKESNSASAMPGTANSSETLKERYRKSFCTQPLPSITSGDPKGLEETRQKIASFLKSREPMKKPKENLARTPVPKPEQSSFAQNVKPNFSKKELNQSSNLIICDAKIKEESISDEDIPLSQLANAAHGANLKMKSKKKPVRCTPTKKMELRRSSKCSNPEPQVVLTKLSDVEVDIKNRTVAPELVKKCITKQERMNVEVKNPEQSESDSDEDKPLYLLGKIIREQEQQKISSSKSSTLTQDEPLSSCQHSKRSATEAILPEIKKNKRAVQQHVSESEDSECGLIIDFDRRPSVEERVPSFKLQRLNTCEELTENRNAITPQESKITSSTPDLPNTPTNNFLSLTASLSTSKAETIEPPQSLSSVAKPDISSLFRDATEEAHILLELSRSGAPLLDISAPTIDLSRPPLDISGPTLDLSRPLDISRPTLNLSQPPLDISGPESASSGLTVDASTSGQEETVKEQDESILRTLLLENGETLQEVTPSTSFDSKPVSLHQYLKNSQQEVHDHSPLSEMDKKQIREEIQMTPDQLSIEIDSNPHFLPAKYESCLSNPKSTLEVIQKLRDQIRYLQRKSERKNTSVLNLKRISKLCKYKGEILNRLLRRANMKEPSEWSQPNTQAAKQLSCHQPISMATSSYAATSLLSSALLGKSLIKLKTPSATVTSSECYPGEHLPTVATMVANATENYGVDLRTVTSRGTPSKTILQEVLSSKEPIYRPVAIRSPLPQLERSSDSFLAFPMSPLVSKESTVSSHRTSSPMLPELSRTSQLSRRLLTPPGSSSQFPPTLQTEPKQSSSFTPVAQSSFRNQCSPVCETEAAKTSLTSSTLSGRTPFSSGSTLQGSSMWGRTEAKRSILSKPQLIKGSPKPSRKRSTDQRAGTSRTNTLSFGFQPNSFDPRAVQLSSIGANPIPSSRSESSDSQGYRVSSGRYTPYDNRTYPVASNQETSVDLRTNPMSYTSSNPGRIANARSSFMIVPPPTTLQSAFSESIRRSMMDSEMPVDRQMERISEQKRDKGSIPLFVPHAGPLKPTSSKCPKCAGCGKSKGCYICSLCKSTYYCSTKCQNLHWDEHSKTCSSKNN